MIRVFNSSTTFAPFLFVLDNVEQLMVHITSIYRTHKETKYDSRHRFDMRTNHLAKSTLTYREHSSSNKLILLLADNSGRRCRTATFFVCHSLSPVIC